MRREPLAEHEAVCPKWRTSMNDGELAARAAMNNALWCDAVCRAHGVPTSFAADAWVAQEAAPRLYPNLVTLSVGGVEKQLLRVAQLTGSLPMSGWGVKDSFNVLDLAPHGFRPMFHARWAAIRANKRIAFEDSKGLRVSRVDSGDGLRQWESAWSVGQSQQDRPMPVFLPAVLQEPDIAFLSLMDGTELAAGLVANRGGGVVGVSNVFLTDGRPPETVCRCLAEIRVMWPGLSLVSYATGNGTGLGRLGFRAFSDLTVWRYVGREDLGGAEGLSSPLRRRADGDRPR
jgi:hypothetical protein